MDLSFYVDVQLYACLSLFQVGTGSLFDQLIAFGNGTHKTSNSCPPDLPQVKAEPLQYSDAEIHALAKDMQKKDNHNMSKCKRKL